MKVLVTGARGMLGYDLLPMLEAAGHQPIGSDRSGEPTDRYAPLDLTDPAAVQAVLARLRPDAILHAAAYTNVDGAEADPQAAYAVNAGGTWNLALAAQALQVPLLLLSTDYVFDGRKGDAYDEYDAPNPQGVYGRSKRAGEMHVERLCAKHFIVRTSWLYGHGGKNFVETILAAASTRPELKVVDDQWGCPTWTRDLCRTLILLLESGHYGTYHVTGTGPTTWKDFAARIVALGGLSTPVLPQSTEQAARPAPRPAYSALRARALELAGFPAMPPWQESLAQYVSARAENGLPGVGAHG